MIIGKEVHDLAWFIEELSPIFPLLREMEKTSQDPRWHEEGDVAIHTQMVLDSVYHLLDTEAAHLNRLPLVLGAVLHDIGKALVIERREDGGILFPKHELVGTDYVAERIEALNLPSETAHLILGLIAYHDRPKRLIVGKAPHRDFQELATLVDLEYLYFLEKADMLGRIAPVQKFDLECLESFRQISSTITR